MADLDNNASAPPVKKKFELFKKKLTPSQAPDLKPGQNHTDAFSRAKDLFPIHVKENEIEREKKVRTLERKRSSKSQSREKSSSSPRLDKRRKISSENVNVNLHDLGSETEDEEPSTRESPFSTPSNRQSQTRSPQKKRRSPTTLMGRFAKDVQSKNKNKEEPDAVAKGYISVSDSDSEDVTPVTQPISRSSSPVVASAYLVSTVDDDKDKDEDAFSEEEFPELLAKARENKRLAELARQRSNSEWANKNHEPDRNTTDDDIFQDRQKGEPVLEIFISSRLESTKTLVIKRKLHQRLREVRQAWCDKQVWDGESIPDDLKDSILLTWRNKRLFDSMTCASLNLDFNTNGDLDSSGDGFYGGKIHMEAWTNELWEEFCKAAEAEEISDDEETVEEVVPEPATRMRLILKAQSKDIKEFKTFVRPTTMIQKLLDGFRTTNKIPADKKIILSFDGDHLEPDTTVEDVGFEDMDTVEVLIR